MIIRNDNIEIIWKIIDERIQYLKIFEGKILDTNDPEKKGRCLVSIPSLGFYDSSKAIYASPIDKNSLITPKINDMVLICFIRGKLENPVYIGKINNLNNQLPQNFDGQSTTQILFENNSKDDFFKYDEILKKFIFNQGNESFVKGDTLYQQLNTILTALKTFADGLTTTNLAANAGILTTALTTALGILSNIKSDKIKGV